MQLEIKKEARTAGTDRDLEDNAEKVTGDKLSNLSTGVRQALATGCELAVCHFEEMVTQLTEFEIRWLLKRGVNEGALWNPWPIGATTIEGIRYFTFVAFDGEMPIDIVLWQPRTNDLFALSGRAIFLGDLDEVTNPATYFDGGHLTIHLTPLEWLKADGFGVVIVNGKLAGVRLRNLPRVFCSDPQLARKVKSLVRSPKPTVKILTASRGTKELVRNVY